MKLLEVDWNAPGGAADVEVDYPDAPLAEFLNWLRRTSAWQETPELVERRVRRLNMVLLDHRNAQSAAESGSAATTPPVPPAPPKPAGSGGSTTRPRTPKQLEALARGRQVIAERRAERKRMAAAAT